MSHPGENILGLESISFIIRLLKRPSLKILILIFSEFPLSWRKHTEPVLQKHKGSFLQYQQHAGSSHTATEGK